jgi:hypothetical protein
MRRPSLKAAVPLAPASFSQNLSNVRVPLLIMGARDDGTIPPSSIDSLWASKPATTKGARVELSGGGHGFPTWGNSQVTRREIPWLKIFLDNDSRYGKFLCPSLADNTGVSRYLSECPYGASTPSSIPPATGAAVVGTGSGRCLDVVNQAQANGTAVALWDCAGGSNQRWERTGAGQLRVYGTKCLGAEGGGTSNGTRAVISDCTDGAAQRWNVNANGTIASAQSGLCLDAESGATANGTRVLLWACAGGSNQRWTIR